jgi:pimeloyl-ACP methyl ester carboxylesterase
MVTFILVHGAWHGGWVWERVRPLLELAGHQVLTPTLAGLGERAPSAMPATGLDDHVRDLLEAIRSVPTGTVHLVAHSYAGVPAAVAADRAAGRVAHLIFLDARVPVSGQRGFDVWPGTEAPFRDASRRLGQGWLVPPPDDTFGITVPADLAWVRARLTPQPLKTYEDRAILSRPVPRSHATAIICTGPATGERVPVADGMRSMEIEAGHDAMVTHPDRLVAALLGIQSSR